MFETRPAPPFGTKQQTPAGGLPGGQEKSVSRMTLRSAAAKSGGLGAEDDNDENKDDDAETTGDSEMRDLSAEGVGSDTSRFTDAETTALDDNEEI